MRLETREVPDPEEDPSSSAPPFVIVRAGTTLAEADRLLIGAALARAGSNVAAAAKELGVPASWLARQVRGQTSETSRVGG